MVPSGISSCPAVTISLTSLTAGRGKEEWWGCVRRYAKCIHNQTVHMYLGCFFYQSQSDMNENPAKKCAWLSTILDNGPRPTFAPGLLRYCLANIYPSPAAPALESSISISKLWAFFCKRMGIRRKSPGCPRS